MSGVQQRLKLKQTPIDTWSLKEQLTLASAVLRTGDQNWVSVSRTMKQFWEPGRPPDWYSQKNCALQYNLIMEKADLPRRKRGEKLEGKDSPVETIVRTLAEQRKVQLAKILEEEKKLIAKLEKEVEILSGDNVSESDMALILAEVEKEEEEEARKDAEHAQFIKNRDEKKLAIQAALKSGLYWKGQNAANSLSEQSGSEVDSALDSPAPPDNDTSEQVTGVESKEAEATSASESDAAPHIQVTSKEGGEKEEDSSILTDLLTSPSKLPVAEEVVEIETSSPLPQENLVDTVKEEVVEEVEETKIIVVDSPDDDVRDPPKTELIKEEIKAEPTEEAVKKMEDAEMAEKLEKTMAEKMEDADDDVIDDAEEITADHLNEDIEEEDEREREREEEREIEKEKVENGQEREQTEEKEIGTKPEKKETGLEKENEAEMEKVGLKNSEKEEEIKEDITRKEKQDLPISEPKEASEQEASSSEPIETEAVKENPEDELSKTKTTLKSETSKVLERPDVEQPIKITPRRGRPRSKKITETAVEVVKEDVEAAEAAAVSPRPTSPSPEVQIRSLSRESESSLRASSRRSSRPSGSRGVVGGGGSRPVSPAVPVTQEDEKDYKVWKKSILMVLSQIAAHKHASLFAAPVSEAEAPKYRQIVYRPMDLGTIKKSIENATIRNTDELQRDLALMFLNATMYNSSDHDVYKFTLAMQRDTTIIIQEFLNTQALLRASENPKLRMKEILEDGPRARTRTGSGSFTLDDRKKNVDDKRKRTSTVEEYPAAKKRRLRNLDE